MKDEIAHLRQLFGKQISNDFIDMIEERNIVFLEDGADINKLTETTPLPVGP
jgi:hypothetical protein